MAFWAAAAPYIAGAASTALSYLSGAKNVEKQIDWEKERATHAHQWEVQDLKAAGLNPILSSGGQGATTGGISAPTVDTSGLMQAANTAISAGFEKQRVNNETDANTALVGKTKAEEMNIMQDTFNKMREEGLIDAKKQREYTETVLKTGQTELVYLQLKREYATVEQEIDVLKTQLQSAKTKAQKETIQNEIDKKLAWLDKAVGFIGQFVGMGTKVGTTAAAINAANRVQNHTTNNYINY